MRAVALSVIVGSLLAACANQPDHRAETAPPATVEALDLTRYAGLWHEIYRYPNRFEEGCAGVTATYEPLGEDRMRVVNRCVRDGEVTLAEGLARRTGEATLEVRFAPAFLGALPFVWGDYWVLALEGDYEGALVGSPDGKYLWVLARSPEPDPALTDALIAAAAARGYETNALVRTPR